MEGYRNGYKGIDVEVLNYTKHPARVMWDMLKQTWISLHDVEYDIYDARIEQMLVDCLSKRVNPSAPEIINIQVVFKGISRVNLAQLTRHRGWLFNSESQMPEHVKHDVIIPLSIVNSKYYARAKKLIEESQKLYDDMVEGDEMKSTTNIPYQDARYLLMHGQTADISASFTMPQLIHSCKQRLENNTNDEINYAFRILLKNLRYAIETDECLDRLDRIVYSMLFAQCDCLGADKYKAIVYDRLFGNSMKRFDDADAIVESTTKYCKMDYTKLAWYKELLRIADEEPELLLPGEAIMIANWRDKNESNEQND